MNGGEWGIRRVSVVISYRSQYCIVIAKIDEKERKKKREISLFRQ
jgi:hypothetical protein